MKEVTRLEIWSVSKVLGVIGFVLGLIAGLVAYFGVKYGGMGMMMPGVSANAKILFSAPILNAVAYFLFGVVFVLVYNFVAKKIGGFKIELK